MKSRTMANAFCEERLPRQHLMKSFKLCHQRISIKHDLGSVSEYVLEWLLSQESAQPAYEAEEISPLCSNSKWQSLHVLTDMSHPDIEQPVSSTISSAATITAATFSQANRSFRRHTLLEHSPTSPMTRKYRSPEFDALSPPWTPRPAKSPLAQVALADEQRTAIQ